ncbi:hypothetical protein [Methanocella arvoryzae]|uniref:Uncharacterized protein n=1 Tax=Methanocella arvoryzae (strain DSM 22066 / NBRC 105507 / MRE50) TaxID=351160 RepID=Q0W0L3_METAR|nr:hypothetical protein [Methanocella arvoryzae]CAJ38080.1 hypothetical protein RRC364 [Methanocella arvoryzae MRE50]
MRVHGIRPVSPAAALLIVLCMVLTSVSMDASASNERKYELRTGNIVMGLDEINSGMFQELFHSQSLSTADTETLGISFPENNGVAITQTSDESILATSTGYFAANMPFYPCLNYGAPPVGIGVSVAAYPVTTAKFSGNTLFFPEMVNQGNLFNNSELRDMNQTRITLPPFAATSATSELRGLYSMQGINNSGFNARASDMPVVLSSQTLDFDATPAHINNTTIIERLWRNSHLGAILDNAYEGDTAYPTWIMPYRNPYSLMEMHSPSTIMKFAFQETMPGTRLFRSFWTL